MNLWLIPILPFAGFLVNGLFGRRLPKAVINSIAIGSVALAFAWVVKTLLGLMPLEEKYIEHYYTWIQSGALNIGFDFAVDRLTAVMLLVVTGVGLLIHIYAIGYMEHEGGYYRFFAYLNLFMFFMLILVLAQNYLLLFVGWEGVGLCSYLLIGFYFLEQYATNAGNKAFIVNRIGDFGFSLAMFLIFKQFGSLDFGKVFGSASSMPAETSFGLMTGICLLLLVGATGKSAQIPLYVWLPDAMAGPTPVSALIHAATMVTAGVYMIARSAALFTRAPIAMDTVAVIGLATAFFAATIGLVQSDIKKVLAYSTVSQLGYMFLACGVGAFGAGIFHLMTHAFFKALLFLSAGSVIHAMGGEQDMHRMGGLRKKIPVTYWTMLVATLAIAGVPGFSGFFSKDEILEAARSGPHAHPTLWILGLAGAGLTSFYMFRLLFLTFFGPSRYDEHAVHVHESPKNMTVPLMILALFALGGGWFAAPHLVGGTDHFEAFLHPVFQAYAPVGAQVAEQASLAGSAGPSSGLGSEAGELFKALAGWPVIVALIGFVAAWWFYIRRPESAERVRARFGALYQVLLNKYYVDEIYAALFVRPLLWISTNLLWHGVDEVAIDGVVDGVPRVARELGSQLRELQSGNTRSYATWVVLGAVGFTVLLLGLLGMAVH